MTLFLLMVLLVTTVAGLGIAITGLRHDLRERHGTPYRQRGPGPRASSA